MQKQPCIAIFNSFPEFTECLWNSPWLQFCLFLVCLPALYALFSWSPFYLSCLTPHSGLSLLRKSVPVSLHSHFRHRLPSRPIWFFCLLGSVYSPVIPFVSSVYSSLHSSSCPHFNTQQRSLFFFPSWSFSILLKSFPHSLFSTISFTCFLNFISFGPFTRSD